jgi:hypothetical protein
LKHAGTPSADENILLCMDTGRRAKTESDQNKCEKSIHLLINITRILKNKPTKSK